MAKLIAPRPLEAADDRSVFDCGKPSLNKWFQERAWKNQQLGVSRTSVVINPEDNRIAAYVSLSAGSIQRKFFKSADRRNAPDPLPVLLLGQLAVDQNFQGRGIARSLLQFTLRTALAQAESIGMFGVLTHPVDAAARDFYLRWGFSELPHDPKGSMILRLKDIQASLH